MSENKNVLFGKINYTLILIGIVLNIIGFVLMMGGAAEDPNTFDGDELFSHVRITLAPIIIVIAYIIIIYGIMRKPTTGKSQEVIITKD